MTYNCRDTWTILIIHSHFKTTNYHFKLKGVHIFESKMQEIAFARNVLCLCNVEMLMLCAVYSFYDSNIYLLFINDQIKLE